MQLPDVMSVALLFWPDGKLQAAESEARPPLHKDMSSQVAVANGPGSAFCTGFEF
jgi:hypothetical protein